MAWGRARGTFERMISEGRTVPDDFLNQPEIEIQNVFYWEAFWDLGSERQVGMGVGPIPNSAMQAFADREGLGADQFEFFRGVIRAVDKDYLDRQVPKAPADVNQNEAVPVSDARGVSGLLRRLGRFRAKPDSPA